MIKTYSKEFRETFPFGKFQGSVKIIEDYRNIEKNVGYLLKYNIIGFDTETKPSFKKGDRHKVALVQFCTLDSAFLFRINKTGFHPAIINLLENEEVLKIGVSLQDDLRELKRIKKFNPCGFVDLQSIAESQGLTTLSLKGLSEEVLHLRISKRQRLTNWEAPQLSYAQISYAATDAWIPLCIYKKLSSSFPKGS